MRRCRAASPLLTLTLRFLVRIQVDVADRVVNEYEEHDVDTSRWFLGNLQRWDGVEGDERSTAATPHTPDDLKQAFKLRSENVDISFGSIFFIFVDDSGSQYIPVVAAKASAQLLVRNWTHSMDAKASFSIVSAYYNARQCVWEPLVEPWYDTGSNERRFDSSSALTSDVPPWTLRLEVRRLAPAGSHWQMCCSRLCAYMPRCRESPRCRIRSSMPILWRSASLTLPVGRLWHRRADKRAVLMYFDHTQ